MESYWDGFCVSGVLNRAEWIKFLGMFFNLDGAATASFNSINTSYYQTQATVSANSTKKPLMAFTQYYTVSPDSAYEIALPAYKRQYIQVIQPTLNNWLAIVCAQLVSSML